MTDSQIEIIKNEINDKVDFSALLTQFLESHEEMISQEIHFAKRAMEKAYDVDPELLKDYQAIDEDPSELDVIDTILFYKLREAIDVKRMEV